MRRTDGGGHDRGTMGGAKLATIVGISIAVFAAASAVAAVGYAEWMWAFVLAGLVLPPLVVAFAVAAALLDRSARAGTRHAGS